MFTGMFEKKQIPLNIEGKPAYLYGPSSFDTLMGYGQAGLNLGKSFFDIKGAMDYQKYLKNVQRDMEMKRNVALGGVENAYQKDYARRAIATTPGMSAADAYASAGKQTEESMRKWNIA
jgi:hypothetical protein